MTREVVLAGELLPAHDAEIFFHFLLQKDMLFHVRSARIVTVSTLEILVATVQDYVHTKTMTNSRFVH